MSRSTKGFSLEGFGLCPVLGNAQGGKIVLCLFHVFAAVVVDDFDLFSEAVNQRGF
jgi:hypothetical protein